MIKNKIIALFAIFHIMTGAIGCSSGDTGKTQEPDQESYWSKKSYQNKLTKLLHPYRIDIQQGNIITDEMRDNLKLGMTKPQVKHLLGTSVLSESYTKDEWLYVYSNSTNGKLEKEQVLVLSFKDDSLNNIQENVVVK